MSAYNPSKGAALITGGAKRIGRSISLSLAELGYVIALHYNRSKKEAFSLKKEIEKSGGRVELFSCNLADTADVSGLIKKVHARCPRLNVLINNASMFQKSTLRKAGLKSIEENLCIHLKSPLILMRDFATYCKRGQVINILDTHIVKNKTAHFLYLLTKKSLRDLTCMAAIELAPRIRVNGIAPGLILPPRNKSNQYLKRLAKDIPLQKKGNANNIVQSVEFLLNNDYLTGQILYNDGGEHLIS